VKFELRSIKERIAGVSIENLLKQTVIIRPYGGRQLAAKNSLP